MSETKLKVEFFVKVVVILIVLTSFQIMSDARPKRNRNTIDCEKLHSLGITENPPQKTLVVSSGEEMTEQLDGSIGGFSEDSVSISWTRHVESSTVGTNALRYSLKPPTDQGDELQAF